MLYAGSLTKWCLFKKPKIQILFRAFVIDKITKQSVQSFYVRVYLKYIIQRCFEDPGNTARKLTYYILTLFVLSFYCRMMCLLQYEETSRIIRRVCK